MKQPLNELNQPVGELLPNWKPAADPQQVVLQGRFCRVEPLSVARHAEALFAVDSIDAAGASWTYLPYGPFPTFASYVAWMQEYCSRDDLRMFAIVDLADSDSVGGNSLGGDSIHCEPVGVSAYLNINPSAGSIEVGHVHYSPRLQQRPAGTEAQYLLMRHAFELGYRRYEWKAHALNAASRAAALRLGFTFEGVFRQAAVVKGRNRDTAWYSITDAEWPRVRAAFERWLAPENFDAGGKQRVRLEDVRGQGAGSSRR
jgi:RimJ/RimL family protein N-acetyltransferase